MSETKETGRTAGGPVRIGVIGAGARMTGVLENVLQVDPTVQVRAVFDPDAAALAEFRGRVAPDVEACPDEASLCGRDDLDWVFIGSPNHAHARQACGALEAGKHVFCEKPLALSLEEAERMRMVWRASGRRFFLGLVLRCSPVYRAARAAIAAGRIGRVLSFEFNETLSFNHGGYIHGNWRRHQHLAGSHLLEKCCHDLDLALWLLDDLPVRVASFGGRSFFTAANAGEAARVGPDPASGKPAFRAWADRHGVDPFNDDKDIVDHQVAILEFSGGARATFHTQCLAALPERRFYILGSEGSLRLDALTGRLEIRRIGWNEETEKSEPAALEGAAGHAGSDLPMAEQLVACMAGRAEPAAGIDEGVRSLALALALDESMERGEVVELAPLADRAAVATGKPVPSGAGMGGVEYLYDPSVDGRLDRDLRRLLSTCFSDPVFRRQRFHHELPSHRWILRDGEGRPVAHAAVHDKRIGTVGGEWRVGGVAEVCVHPAHRGRGHVRRLLEAAHAWMRSEGIPFSILLGRTEVYRGLGYVPAGNPVRHYHTGEKRWVSVPLPAFHVLALGPQAWPDGEIDLRGPLF